MTYFLEKKKDGFYYHLSNEIEPWIERVSLFLPKELALFVIEYCFLKIKKESTYVILFSRDQFKSVHLVRCREIGEREHCFFITFELIQNYDFIVYRAATFSHCELGVFDYWFDKNTRCSVYNFTSLLELLHVANDDEFFIRNDSLNQCDFICRYFFEDQCRVFRYQSRYKRTKYISVKELYPEVQTPEGYYGPYKDEIWLDEERDCWCPVENIKNLPQKVYCPINKMTYFLTMNPFIHYLCQTEKE